MKTKNVIVAVVGLCGAGKSRGGKANLWLGEVAGSREGL